MNKSRKIIPSLYAILLLFLGITLLLALRPVPKANMNNCIKISGNVIRVDEGGGQSDIIIDIQGDDSYYYINRGLEMGINLKEMQIALINESAELFYIKHWTPLDPGNKSRHVARVACKGEVFYNEMSK